MEQHDTSHLKGFTIANGVFPKGNDTSHYLTTQDWSSSLGEMAYWPQSLKAAVNLIMQSSLSMAIIWGPEGILLYNDAYSQMAGDKHPAIFGQKVRDAWPHSKEFLEQDLPRVLRGESFFVKRREVILYKNAEVRPLWLDVSFSPLLNEEGVPEGILAIGIDVTQTVLAERNEKAAQLALRESEERYSLAVEASHDGIWDFDLVSKKSFWSQRYYEIIGYTAQDIPQPNLDLLLAIIHPEDKDRVHNAFLAALEQGMYYEAQYRVLHKNGHYIYLHSKGKPVFNKVGEIVRVAGIISDITLRKKTEEENQKLIAILGASADYVSLASLDGNALYVNPAGLQMVGWESFEGRNMLDAIYPEDRLFATSTLLPQLLQQGNFAHEIRFWNEKTGNPFWLKWKGIAIKDPTTGEITALATISPDITKRKQAEQALKESEERFLGAIEAIQGVLWTNNAQGQMEGEQLGWASLTGQSFEEYQGSGWANAVHPEDVQPTVNAWQEAVREQKMFVFEHRVRLKNGQYRQFSIRAIPLKHIDGTVREWVGVHTDITERKQAEKALKDSESRYRTLIEESSVATSLYFGRDLRIQYANKIMMDYWGKGTDVIGKTLGEILPELKGQPFLGLLDDVYTTGRPYVGTEERADLWVDNKLQTFYFNFTYKALYNEQGEIYAIHHMAIDVSHQVLAKNAQSESETRFRTLADQVPQFIWMTGTEGGIAYSNKTFLNFLGLSHLKEFLATTWEQFIHPEDMGNVLAVYNKALANQSTYMVECRLKEHASGIYRWVMIKGVPRRGADGNFAGYVGTGVDVHEQKMILEQLELKNNQLVRINNDLDNFVYTASHDLKSPMSNIEGLVHALRETLEAEKLDQDTGLLLELMETSIDRFKTTILDLTEISKVQKLLEEDIVEVDIATVIEDVKLSINDKFMASGAIVHTDFASASAIKFSKKNLKSVVYNLLSNAIKYRDPERPCHIYVKTEIAHNHIVLTVEDNGLGISKQNQEKMFTMFKRFHNHVEGTGIGLYIIKRIIDNAGGRIEVESELDKGTVFKVYFIK